MAIARGHPGPHGDEIAEHYTTTWSSEVPVDIVLAEMGGAMARVTDVRPEPASPLEARLLLASPEGGLLRLRCVVEPTPPHRIAFQILSPAVDPSAYVDRAILRPGGSTHLRDFGGTGPLLLLWHGAGCDASVWEGLVPHLRGFRVVAQDLPAHGTTTSTPFSVAAAVTDGHALAVELGLGDPIVLGHSLGGWVALHFAATRPCRALVCLDGPTSLDYVRMGLGAGHPAHIPDPPQVVADLAAVTCPTMVALCRGTSKRQEARMVPFRAELGRHLKANHPQITVEWPSADHNLIVSQPERTAFLVSRFLGMADLGLE